MVLLTLTNRDMPLVILENEDLSLLAEDLRLQLQQNAIRRRIAHELGTPADLQVIDREKEVLNKEYAAVLGDIDALTIRAPIDGTVIADDLHDLVNTYLSKGSEIMWLVSPDKKILTVSFSQQDINALQSQARQRVEVDMRATGLGTFSATLVSLQPTAGTTLPSPFLAALYGGPLDVRQTAVSTQDNMQQRFQIELFAPRFTGYVALPTEILEKARAGQAAQVNTTGLRVNLASWTMQHIRSWLEQKGGPQQQMP